MSEIQSNESALLYEEAFRSSNKEDLKTQVKVGGSTKDHAGHGKVYNALKSEQIARQDKIVITEIIGNMTDSKPSDPNTPTPNPQPPVKPNPDKPTEPNNPQEEDGRTNVTWSENGREFTEQAIFKVVNNGKVTYEIVLQDLEGGHHKLENLKPTDTVKFIGDITLTKIETQAPFLENQLSLPKGKNVFFVKGDDVYIYLSGDDNDTYNFVKDNLIILKNVSLGDLQVGDTLTLEDGILNIYEHKILDGLVKVSDKNGFTKFFGEDGISIKLGGFGNVYKNKDGKFFLDAQGTQELDYEAPLNIHQIKFSDGSVFTTNSKLLKSLNLNQAKNLTYEEVINHAAAGDTLVLGDTTYVFKAGNTINQIKIGNSAVKEDNFIFTDHSGSDKFINIDIVSNKAITIEKFLNGQFDKNYIYRYDTVNYKGLEYTFDVETEIVGEGENKRLETKKLFISKIKGFGKQDGFDSIEELGVSVEAIASFKDGLIEKIADNAILKIKDTNLSSESLKSLEKAASKIADGVIKGASLSVEELAKVSKTLLSKIADNSITLTDNTTFDADKIEEISLDGSLAKLKAGSIKDASLSADDAAKILKIPGNNPVFNNKSITIADSADKITQMFENFSDYGYLVSKLKSIDATDNGTITLSKDMFNKIGVDNFADDDQIVLTGLGAQDKNLALNSKVDQFAFNTKYAQMIDWKLSVEEFKILAQKSINAKFKIVDTTENIKNNLDFLVQKADKLFDSAINSTDDQTITLSDEQNEALKGKFHSSEDIQTTPKETPFNGDVENLSDYMPQNYSNGSNVKVMIDVQKDVYAGDANEIFVFAKDIDKIEINYFNSNNSQDKINVKALGGLDKALTEVTNNQAIENGKIYDIDINSRLYDEKDYSSDAFSELFGEGKAFNGNIEANAKAVILVKGVDESHIYSIENNGDNILDKSEIKLVGTVTTDSYQGIDFNNNNVDFS
ncbi:hypothetical protein [Campylobacter sp.]|uniref:hypothetical protein n=1 Tax=Campylobacter sp. TaxID=205 RepID=UPI0026F92BBD|nr:hypothetical protein [Campylobacter sp.]